VGAIVDCEGTSRLPTDAKQDTKVVNAWGPHESGPMNQVGQRAQAESSAGLEITDRSPDLGGKVCAVNIACCEKEVAFYSYLRVLPHENLNRFRWCAGTGEEVACLITLAVTRDA